MEGWEGGDGGRVLFSGIDSLYRSKGIGKCCPVFFSFCLSIVLSISLPI